MEKAMGAIISLGLIDEVLRRMDGDKSRNRETAAIYELSVARILKVADRMARGKLREDEEVYFATDAKVPDLPDKDVWDFQLGDAVKVKLSRKDFKYVQQKTTGWRLPLNRIHGHIGVITSWQKNFANEVSVLFPLIGIAEQLFIGTLQKVETPVFGDLNPRWKVGDYVKSISPKSILDKIQLLYDEIPKDQVGIRGRVTGFTQYHVLVTFNNTHSIGFRSESLIPSDDTKPLAVKAYEHPRGFKAGEKVQVISNMKKLIENQKKSGEKWKPEMSELRGESVTVVGVTKSESVLVQTRYSGTWNLNHESLLLSVETEPESEDLEFLPGDIVKVVVRREDRESLAANKVTITFLELMRISGVVTRIDNEKKTIVSFFSGQHFDASGLKLRKATAEEKENYQRIQDKVTDLKVGDQVCLDIGPPNFVCSVTERMKLDADITRILVKPAQLIGFIDPYTAVIEYENKQRFKIKKKYLTVTEKFRIGQPRKTLTLDVFSSIQAKIFAAVQDIHSRKDAPTEDWKVDTVFVSDGEPPCAEFRVQSTIAKFEEIYQWMNDNSGWQIRNVGYEQLIVSGSEIPVPEIIVAITFNEEPRVFSNENMTQIIEFSHEEGAPASLKARPIPDDRQHRVEQQPVVNSVNDFRYIQLYDQSLGRDVYFPYIVHGPQRQPADAVDGDDRNQHGNVNTTYNFENVGNINIHQPSQ